jgi:hypothetical protein
MNKIKIPYDTITTNIASDKITNYVYQKTYMVIPYWVMHSHCHEE